MENQILNLEALLPSRWDSNYLTKTYSSKGDGPQTRALASPPDSCQEWLITHPYSWRAVSTWLILASSVNLNQAPRLVKSLNYFHTILNWWLLEQNSKSWCYFHFKYLLLWVVLFLFYLRNMFLTLRTLHIKLDSFTGYSYLSFYSLTIIR